MGFYTVLSAVDRLLAGHHWHLRLCRRHGDATLRYFVTDAEQQVLVASGSHRRLGLTLPELLLWLERSGDAGLSAAAHAMREQIEHAA